MARRLRTSGTVDNTQQVMMASRHDPWHGAVRDDGARPQSLRHLLCAGRRASRFPAQGTAQVCPPDDPGAGHKKGGAGLAACCGGLDAENPRTTGGLAVMPAKDNWPKQSLRPARGSGIGALGALPRDLPKGNGRAPAGSAASGAYGRWEPGESAAQASLSGEEVGDVPDLPNGNAFSPRPATAFFRHVTRCAPDPWR